MEIVEYLHKSVVIKTLIKKTGNLTASPFDSEKDLTEKISPFDPYIQRIEGKAEIIINEKSQELETRQSIIIHAHSRQIINASERLKIISTVIKSRYEDMNRL